eukprot:TRINITY_DN3319_c0_g4_i1.p1 TRINITY_DN3319_c0_g4~~TRINITY_DN3319_c0_g4_i1.p1  ORF type:complete len:416 (+),score=-59.71 TRINITY_DN3319_c0_g4_i1:34-1248(+)
MKRGRPKLNLKHPSRHCTSSPLHVVSNRFCPEQPQLFIYRCRSSSSKTHLVGWDAKKKSFFQLRSYQLAKRAPSRAPSPSSSIKRKSPTDPKQKLPEGKGARNSDFRTAGTGGGESLFQPLGTLVNSENLCFLIVTFQLLAACFISGVVNLTRRSPNSIKGAASVILDKLKLGAKKSAHSLEPFLRFARLDPGLSGYFPKTQTQQDPSDIIPELISLLGEEQKFNLILDTNFTCASNHTRFVKRWGETVQHVELPTESVSFASFIPTVLTRPIQIEARCESPGCDSDSGLMTTAISSAPAYIIIRFKRAVSLNGKKNHVAFESLDTPVVINSKSSSSASSSSHTYELVSIIVHEGSKARSGHLICVRRDSYNNWHLLDDNTSRPLKGSINQFAGTLTVAALKKI